MIKFAYIMTGDKSLRDLIGQLTAYYIFKKIATGPSLERHRRRVLRAVRAGRLLRRSAVL